MVIPAAHPTDAMSTKCLFPRFRFFEAEEVKVAADVTGDDQSVKFGNGAAFYRTVVGEGSQTMAALEIPHLQLPVIGGRDRRSPVRGHRHRGACETEMTEADDSGQNPTPVSAGTVTVR